jgi:hypothetical protein
MQAGLGVALDRELALEEEGVRVLGANGEFDELRELAANVHARLRGRDRREPAARDAERHARARILHDDPDGATVELAQALAERLAAHQVVEGVREELRVHAVRHQPERDGKDRFEGNHMMRRILAADATPPLDLDQAPSGVAPVTSRP